LHSTPKYESSCQDDTSARKIGLLLRCIARTARRKTRTDPSSNKRRDSGRIGLRICVKHIRHPTRRSCKVSTSETYNQCNLYGTATRRTVATRKTNGATFGQDSALQPNGAVRYTADIAAWTIGLLSAN